MSRYTAIMSQHDDAFTFEVPVIPGFFAQIDGTDIRAAIAEAESVLSDHIGAMLDEGMAVPEPGDLATSARIAIDRRIADPDRDDVPSAMVVLTARPVGGKAVRANISMDSGTLGFIDETARARGLTRSAFLAEAARAYA
jgi:predicted RNase H-like HicB family nuclease